MKRAWVVVIVVLYAVFGIPPSAFASGSYGAVLEKGVRGCTTDDLTGIGRWSRTSCALTWSCPDLHAVMTFDSTRPTDARGRSES